jgi:formyl-CoA transferase
MILGDLGAEVIKIEKTEGGDDFRRLGPPVTEQEGAPFLWCNRNKKSIALNLKHPEGLDIARDIVARSDVVVENFSTGVMARFGLDYKTVSAGNPKLIYASVSAYGRDGPLKNRVGFDPIVQAETGFISMNGDPNAAPVRALPSIVDINTATMTASAVLAALFSRERTGQGQYIESALYDTAVIQLGFQAMSFLYSGREPVRSGNNSPDPVPCAAFDTMDGAIYVDCTTDRTWNKMATTVLERPDLATHPDFENTFARVRNRDALMTILQDILKTKSRKHWLPLMWSAGVPAGAINSLTQAFGSDEMASRKIVQTVPHPAVGSVPNIRLPFQMSGTPLVDPVAAPCLSQHAVEILRDVLGRNPARIKALAASGAVALPTGRSERFPI